MLKLRDFHKDFYCKLYTEAGYTVKSTVYNEIHRSPFSFFLMFNVNFTVKFIVKSLLMPPGLPSCYITATPLTSLFSL